MTRGMLHAHLVTVGLHLILLLHVFFVIASLQIVSGIDTRRSTTVKCLLSSSWWGLWFQKGMSNYIRIDTKSISSKGDCIASDGHSRFLFTDKSPEPCVRCMVITQNHQNILQYRETHCYAHGTFRELCSMISSDQELYPMFRVDADPIKCPLRGPFTFTYSRSGKPTCADPVSRADVCSHDSKLQFRFQACADVLGSQSSVETMTCLATWREGPVSYLIAKLDHQMVANDNDRYRCFVYEKVRKFNSLIISQSEDATCNGLRESADGDRVMNLVPDNSIRSGCNFPSWITRYDRWHQISSNITFVFTNTTFVAVKFLEYGRTRDEHLFRSFCLKNISTSLATFKAITHTTIGCDQAYACVSFRRRQKHILQITSGKPERSIEDACKNDKKNIKKNTVLLAPVGKTMECSKIDGRSINKVFFEHSYLRRQVEGSVLGTKCDKPSELHLNCGSASWMSVRHTHCHHGLIPNIILECHFVWKSNGSTYLVTSSHDRHAKYCFVFNRARREMYIREGDDCKTYSRANISETYRINHIEWCDELNTSETLASASSSVLLALSILAALFTTDMCLLT